MKQLEKESYLSPILHLLDKSIRRIKNKILRVLDNLDKKYYILIEVITMRCENFFCIYNEEEKCLLDEIELDICGLCKSCIYVNIDRSEIVKRKKEQLEKRY